MRAAAPAARVDRRTTSPSPPLRPFVPTSCTGRATVSTNFRVKSVTLDDIARSYWMYSGSIAVFILADRPVVLGVAHLRRTPRRDGVWPLLLGLMLLPGGRAGRDRDADPGRSTAAVRDDGERRHVRPRRRGRDWRCRGVLGVATLIAIVALSPFGDRGGDPARVMARRRRFPDSQNMRPGDLAVVSASASTRLYDYYVDRHDVGLRRHRHADAAGHPPARRPARVWLVIHDPWYPVNLRHARTCRIERRSSSTPMFSSSSYRRSYPGFATAVCCQPVRVLRRLQNELEHRAALFDAVDRPLALAQAVGEVADLGLERVDGGERRASSAPSRRAAGDRACCPSRRSRPSRP